MTIGAVGGLGVAVAAGYMLAAGLLILLIYFCLPRWLQENILKEIESEEFLSEGMFKRLLQKPRK